MALSFKKANEHDLNEINMLIVASEMVSTGRENDRDVFIAKYTISKHDLLMNNSYVLYEDKNMVGFFMIKNKCDEHELEYFYIKSNQLGKGYGKILWNYVANVCIKNNIRKINIACGKNVTGFYLKMGAENIGETDSKVYHGVKIDVLQCQIK